MVIEHDKPKSWDTWPIGFITQNDFNLVNGGTVLFTYSYTTQLLNRYTVAYFRVKRKFINNQIENNGNKNEIIRRKQF